MSNAVTIPRELLEAPFPAEAIKTRPGAFGNSLSYLEGHTVIARLNAAFDGRWSFEVVSHQILDDEVLVQATIRVEPAGPVKTAFGSSSITRDRRSGNATNLGDDLKAACTDALKKAATLLGVGLYLYGASAGEPAGQDREPDRTGHQRSDNSRPAAARGTNGNGRITNRQISAIFAIARDRGMSNADVRALAQERFDRTVDYLSKAEASSMIEELLGQ
jgi:hypothetical protein